MGVVGVEAHFLVNSPDRRQCLFCFGSSLRQRFADRYLSRLLRTKAAVPELDVARTEAALVLCEVAE
jgi:hypothetical protein